MQKNHIVSASTRPSPPRRRQKFLSGKRLKIKDAIIAWNTVEYGGDICIAPLGDPTWGYTHTTGGCLSDVQRLSHTDSMLYAMAQALHLIVRLRLNPNRLHRAMLDIEEYHSAYKKYRFGI